MLYYLLCSLVKFPLQISRLFIFDPDNVHKTFPEYAFIHDLCAISAYSLWESEAKTFAILVFLSANITWFGTLFLLHRFFISAYSHQTLFGHGSQNFHFSLVLSPNPLWSLTLITLFGHGLTEFSFQPIVTKPSLITNFDRLGTVRSRLCLFLVHPLSPVCGLATTFCC